MRKSFTVEDIALIPQYSSVRSRFSDEIELYPFIYSAPMDRVTGYELTKAMLKHNHCPVISRFLPKDEYLRSIRELAINSDNCFVAVGLMESYTEWLIDIGSTIESTDWTINVAIDIAHGDSQNCIEAIRKLRASKHIKYIMSGSICTDSAAYRLVTEGVTHLRVGIGVSPICSTRRMTGFGIPNAHAISLIANAIDRSKVTIIADGGITEPGQAVKYIVLGAHAIMLGNILSRTAEAPGWETKNWKKVKTYRGQASKHFQSEVLNKKYHCPEGIALEEFVWQGDTVESMIMYFEGGVRSALSYADVPKLKELYEAQIPYVFLTESGIREGHTDSKGRL